MKREKGLEKRVEENGSNGERREPYFTFLNMKLWILISQTLRS